MIVSRKGILSLVLVFCCLLSVSAFASAKESFFSKSDYNNAAEEAADAVITLDENRGTLSDTTRGQSGNPVVIERKGVYRITGSADGVRILINEPKKSGNIYMILDEVSMTNETGPCIESQAAEKTILQCVGENALISHTEKGGAVSAEDDLTVNGTGSLTIESGKNGIHCKGVLRITGGELTIQAENDGLKGKHGIFMDGGSVTVAKSYEGLEGSRVGIFGGELNITASDDAINAADADEPMGDVTISGGMLYLNSFGDAIDSNHSILVEGGTLLVEGPENSRNSIFDKGDGADALLSISGGTVLAIGSAEKAKNFTDGTQYSRLEKLPGHAGDVITTDDGSGISLTASRDYDCVIYSSPNFTEENQILVRSGAVDAEFGEIEDVSAYAENEYMQAAIQEALEGITHEHGGPFGSVIVKDGEIVGRDHNRVLCNHDPSAHGEIQAIRNAGSNLGTHDLSGCDIYTTGAPCPMCLYACLWANIDRVYYGGTIEDNAAIGFRDEEFESMVDLSKLPEGYFVCIDRDACQRLYQVYLSLPHETY